MDHHQLKRSSRSKFMWTSSELRVNGAPKKKFGRSSTEQYSTKRSFHVMDQRQRKILVKAGTTIMSCLNQSRTAKGNNQISEAAVNMDHQNQNCTSKSTSELSTSSRWSKVKKSLKARGEKEGWKGRSLAKMIVNQVHKTEIPEVVINIYGDLRRASNHLPTSCSICKVPNNLRDVHRNAFDPKLVSIGPFHRDKPHLKAMEEHKLRFISSHLIRGGVYEPSTSTITDGDVFEKLARAMKEIEVRARECYSPTYGNISSNEFVRLMIIDGCFVVELMRHYYLYVEHHQVYNVDPIFTTRWMVPNLQLDLLLLENQLPFFVLEKIFELTNKTKDETDFLTTLTLTFFNPLLPRAKEIIDNYKPDAKAQHLLDLFHSSFLSSVKKKKIIT